MSFLTQRTLRVFSVLEAYRGTNDDIIDALLPFFEPLLGDLTGDVYNPTEFAAKVRAAYRWNFTADIAEELIQRFEHRGWLHEIGATGAEKAYQVSYHPSSDDEVPSTTTAIESKLEEIVMAFAAFIQEMSPLTGYERSPGELSDILVEWLLSIDAYDEDVLRQQMSTIGFQDTGSLGLIEAQPEEASHLSDEDKYLCARFVKHLNKENSPWLADLCRVASIGLLTEVIQDFMKPTTAVTKSDLAVYLDAPIAMDLLGLSGRAAKENIQPILRSLSNIGCQIRIFRTSVDEMRRVLRVILDLSPSERTGAIANGIRRGEVVERYAVGVRDRPDEYLENLGVRVVDQDLDQFPNTHVYFSKEISEELFAAIRWHQNPVPREHDATVLTITMRKRGKSQSVDVFRTKHLFVTKNPFLAQLARRFCVEAKLIRDNQMPPAIHQRQLATLTWLRTGLGADKEVPKRYLLDACERVLNIKKHMVEKARHAVADLTDEQKEQLEILLTEDRSVQVMMDKTLGSSAVVDGSNMPQLIEAMKQSLVADIAKKKKKEVATVRKQAKIKMDAAEGARQNAEEQKNELETQIVSNSVEDRRLIENVSAITNKRIRRFRRTLNVGISIFVAGIVTLPLVVEFLPTIARYTLLIVGGTFSAYMGAVQLWDRNTSLGRLVAYYARGSLARVVKKRGLEAKIAAHPLEYDGKKFCIGSAPHRPLDKLL